MMAADALLPRRSGAPGAKGCGGEPGSEVAARAAGLLGEVGLGGSCSAWGHWGGGLLPAALGEPGWLRAEPLAPAAGGAKGGGMA
jgi:hypothetical protein